MNFRESFMHLFYPTHCLICDRVISRNDILCESCKKLKLPHDKKGACPVCGLSADVCSCERHLLYKQSAFPFFYRDEVALALQKYKFRSRLDKAKGFARMMTEALEERDILSRIDMITFIPMQKSHRFFRGYNQAQLLAREISRLTGKPCEPLLYKYFKTPAQHSMSRFYRRGNVLGIFEPLPEAEDFIKGKTVLVTDDILTTGSTVNEAAKTLLIFGAEAVFVTTAAATPKKKKKERTQP